MPVSAVQSIQSDHQPTSPFCYGLDAELGVEKREKADNRRIEAALSDFCAYAGWQVNGGHIGQDCGHAEIRLPECSDVLELVRYERAMQAIAAEIGEAFRLDFFNHLVDFGGPAQSDEYCATSTTRPVSWGAHLNIFTDAPSERIQELFPFLVSSAPITGAGGIEPLDNSLLFACNRRVRKLTCLSSAETVSNKPIINTRDESHSSIEGFWRYHHTSLDANMNSVQRLVSIGSLALVVRLLADHHLRPELGHRMPDIELDRKFLLQDYQKIGAEMGEWKIPHVNQFLSRGSGEVPALDIQVEYWKTCKRAYYQNGNEVDRLVIDKWEAILGLLLRPHPIESTLGYLDWSTKFMLAVNEVGDVNDPKNETALRILDLSYHKIGKSGTFEAIFEAEKLVQSVIEPEQQKILQQTPPDNTRAYFRGELLREVRDHRSAGGRAHVSVSTQQWDTMSLHSSVFGVEHFPMPEPRRPYVEYLERAIELLRAEKKLGS